MRVMVGDELREFLLFAHHFGRAPRARVERRLRHLRREFVEAALKRCEIRKVVHGNTRRGQADLRIARTAGCDWMRQSSREAYQPSGVDQQWPRHSSLKTRSR